MVFLALITIFILGDTVSSDRNDESEEVESNDGYWNIHLSSSVKVSSGMFVGNGTGNENTTTSSLTPELELARLREELANLTQVVESMDSATEARLSQLINKDNQLQSGQNNLQNELNQVVNRMGSAEGRLDTLPGNQWIMNY